MREDELDLFGLLEILMRRRRTLLLFLVGAVILSCTYALTTRPRWTSTASLLPTSQTGGLRNLVGLAATAGLDIPNQSIPDDSPILYPEILRSRTIGAEILWSTIRCSDGGTQRESSVLEYLAQANLDDALAALNNRMAVTINNRTGTVTLKVETWHPEVSRQIASMCLQQLQSFSVDTRKQRSMEVLSFIEQRLADQKHRLDVAEEKRMVWRSANSTWYQSRDAEVLKRQAELDRDVTIHQATYITLAEQYEIAQIESQKDLHTITVMDHPNLPRKRSHPKRKLIVVISSVLGLLVGVFAVFVQEAWANHPELAGLLRRKAKAKEDAPAT
jgi:uncharacterized protein involved in exopolysaccharide biosynthesis